MVGFRNRGWGLILPGCSETLTFSRGETVAARPAPPHWARAGEGPPSANVIGARNVLDRNPFPQYILPGCEQFDQLKRYRYMDS